MKSLIESILSKTNTGFFFFKEDMFKSYSNENLSYIINMSSLIADAHAKFPLITKQTDDSEVFIKMLCTVPFTRKQKDEIDKQEDVFFDYIIREKFKKYIKRTTMDGLSFNFYINKDEIGYKYTSWGKVYKNTIATFK